MTFPSCTTSVTEPYFIFVRLSFTRSNISSKLFSFLLSDNFITTQKMTVLSGQNNLPHITNMTDGRSYTHYNSADKQGTPRISVRYQQFAMAPHIRLVFSFPFCILHIRSFEHTTAAHIIFCIYILSFSLLSNPICSIGLLYIYNTPRNPICQ